MDTQSFCTVHPYFTMLDEPAVRSLIVEFVKKTQSEDGCMWYSFDIDIDKKKLYCNECYVNAEAVLVHLENVGALLGRMIGGPASLDRLEIHGPQEEVEKLKPKAAEFNASLFVVDSGFDLMRREFPKRNDWPLCSCCTGLQRLAGGCAVGCGKAQICTIHPYFTIFDEEAAKNIMKKCVEITKDEPGCLYYGWTRCGNKIFCREGYVDGDAIVAHIENAGGLVGRLIAEGAKLEEISFHGPQAELDKTRELAKKFNASLMMKDSGFQRCARN